MSHQYSLLKIHLKLCECFGKKEHHPLICLMQCPAMVGAGPNRVEPMGILQLGSVHLTQI